MQSAAPDDMVLIYGCPRSGTYLLQQLVGEAFSVAFPVESHFIPAFLKTLPIWGNLDAPKNRRRLLEAIFEFTEIFTYRVLWSHSKEAREEKDVRFTLLSARAATDEIVAGSLDFKDMVGRLYAEFSRLQGKRLRGDKSTFFFPVPLEDLARAIPTPKVIHIVRDGRDVCLSWMRTWHRPASVIEAAALWREHVAAKRAWGEQNPDRYLEVRYEDLLADQGAVLDRIAAFLGADRPEDIIDLADNEMARQLASVYTHTKLTGGIQKDNQQKWRHDMSETDLRYFETVAGDLLEQLGYPCAFPAGSRRPDLRFLSAWLVAWAKQKAGLHYWRIKFRDALPLVIRLAVPLGIPVARLVNR